MTCRHCLGLLRRNEDGLLLCWACGRPADPPPIMPVDKWPGGVQPPPPTPTKPRSGNHAAKPPHPSAEWRQTVFGKAAPPRGKRHVAPTRVNRRGGLWGET